jgi:hypothetical protein
MHPVGSCTQPFRFTSIALSEKCRPHRPRQQWLSLGSRPV